MLGQNRITQSWSGMYSRVSKYIANLFFEKSTSLFEKLGNALHDGVVVKDHIGKVFSVCCYIG